MNILTKDLSYKLVAILSILFSTLAIGVAFKNPVRGYELSIYDSTPSIVWFSLILSIIGALFILICQISMNKYMSSNSWIIGIFILLLNRLILLYIPYIRGYFSWRGDNIVQVGYLIDLITSGHIPYYDFYPITHIFLATFNIITGISLNVVVNYSTGILSLFYVISIYLLAKVSLYTKKEQILAVASVAIVFFSYNVYLMPNGWSQLYFPLLVFLYFKSLGKHNSLEYTLLFVILLIMYPFFHPLSALYIIIILISIAIFSIYLFIVDEKNYMELTNQTKKYAFTGQLFSNFIKCLKTKINISALRKNDKYFFPVTAIFVEVVIFISWILSFEQFNININILYNSLRTGTSVNVIGGMQSTLDKINVSGIDFIQILVKIEGANLIFLGLFAISLFILSKKKYDLQKNRNLTILSSIIIFTGFIYAAHLFRIVPGLQAIAALRIKSYIVLLTPISAGFVLAHFFRKKLSIKNVNIVPMLCMFIIFSASILSIFSLYPSPNIISPTPSITQMDMKGAEWYVNYHNNGILTTPIMSPVYVFTDGIIGIIEQEKIFGSSYLHTNVPDHFNYTNMSKLGESYLEDRYMMVTKFDAVIYSTVWSVVGRFNPHDFDRLLRDNSVEKIYSNGETEFFFIHTIRVL